MQTVSFLTLHPFDHVQRALDILRKMHFSLVRLSVEPSDQAFMVVITFEQSGGLSVDVFIHRLAQLDGLVLRPMLAAGTESRGYPMRCMLQRPAFSGSTP